MILMMVQVLRSKIHRARVTGANVKYKGSFGLVEEGKKTKPKIVNF